MALETLRDTHQIDDFPVQHISNGKISLLSDDIFIHVDHDTNTISFKIQDGPIKEAGLNGCQLDELIKVAYLMIEGLNSKLPCEENLHTMHYLLKAIQTLKERKTRREFQGIEGIYIEEN